MHDMWTVGDWPDIEASLLDEIRSNEMITKIVIEECVSRYDVRCETSTGFALAVVDISKAQPNAEQQARDLAADFAQTYGLNDYEFVALPGKEVK